MGEAFFGAKVMIFIGAALLVIRRDEFPSIPDPNRLDFPGGGREGCETPEETVIRETREEVGLRLSPEALTYKACAMRPKGKVWFFAAHLPEGAEAGIVFGDEGQGWQVMPPEDYLTHPDRIARFADQLSAYLALRRG